jgi:hypothetical protein
MGVENFIETEVGVAVAATAALFSPRARNVMRRGAVYGLAGALKAGDAVSSAARGVARGARSDEAPAPPAAPTPPPRGGGRQSRARSAPATGTAAEAQP